MLYDEQVHGSTEQKKYKEKCLSGGTMSPKEGIQTFYSNYCTNLTHGLPTGQSNDAKKAVRQKIAGGRMSDVLHN